jgi:CubicO group peptidase (beta-lactamase class C family)
VDRFINAQLETQRIPGLALAITHNDQVVYVRGYGTAGNGQAVTEKTQFRLASLSKSFTALAVLQLVEAGRINLDKPASHYLPDLTLAIPAAAANFTVRQLLNHTSGLADTGFTGGLARQQETLADRVSSLRTARTVSPPGAAFHYFDPNYQVLARLVEVVSEQSFDAYLQAHVFTPLAMRETMSAVTSDDAATRAKSLAQGHIVVYGVPLAMPELSGLLGGSGGVVSTAEDMTHYLIAQSSGGRYKDGRVLSARNIALMQTPPNGVASNYGMGWVASEVNGTQTIEHNGVLSTFYAEAVLLPKSGYGFALLYNEYALNASILAFPALKDGMVALLTGQKPADGGMTVPTLGYYVAAISMLGIGLAIWSLLRLRRWQSRSLSAPRWQIVTGLIWLFVPAILLLALPHLLAQITGRYFGFVMLARAMPEIIVFLVVCGSLCALSGIARLVFLIRHMPRPAIVAA